MSSTELFSEINIKCEPEEGTDEDNSYNHQIAENYVHVKPEFSLEYIPVKIELNKVEYNDHEEQWNDDMGNEFGAECKEEDKGDMNAISNIIQKKRPHIKKRRNSDDIDEDYVPPKKSKKKKKKEPNVKPSLKGKPRKMNGIIYSDDITKHIEIVTIDEQERQIEHRELMNGRRHMRYQCEDCAVGYVVIEAYKMHMKIHSPENGEHECDLCHTRVKTAGVLYRHKLRHYRRYRCALCHTRHRDKDTAAAHVMDEHLGTAFLCVHCGRGFKRPQYLKRHIEQIHTKPHRFECPVCQRVFHERGWYRCHVRSHNEEARNSTSKQPVICSYCDRSFKNKSYLKRHLQRHEGSPAAFCPDCQRVFKNAEVLRVHCRQVHNANRVSKEAKKTQCNVCLRICATRAMLNRHIQRMHSDRTKKFQCEYCKRLYLTKGEVRSHIMWSHMSRTGGHACACGRVFRSPARLKAHAAARHLQLPPPRDKACPVCQKTFANQQVLNRHIKGHSGETYPCNTCGQTFKTQSYVKVHYKIKHLNMTRAEVKAQSKRKLLMVDDEAMNAKIKARKSKDMDPLVVDTPVQVKSEPKDVEVPVFDTFVEIQRN